ncbi:MAG TPA: Verru_Chthon cassette protein B [Terrimicrobiaceae bacterium]|nr:Verru_Chthon cassette protein B [Terrimicrobiaceae bacterium]
MSGFSLVEVTLALGIVSFSLVILVGAMPVGLIAAQEAMRQTARSHILRQISGDLAMLSSDERPAYLAQTQYYDSDGKRLPDSEGAVFETVLASDTPSYPGSTNLSGLSDRLSRVQVSIRRHNQSTNGAYRTTLQVFCSSTNF